MCMNLYALNANMKLDFFSFTFLLLILQDKLGQSKNTIVV